MYRLKLMRIYFCLFLFSCLFSLNLNVTKISSLLLLCNIIYFIMWFFHLINSYIDVLYLFFFGYAVLSLKFCVEHFFMYFLNIFVCFVILTLFQKKKWKENVNVNVNNSNNKKIIITIICLKNFAMKKKFYKWSVNQ